jgi:hypothetical protein
MKKALPIAVLLLLGIVVYGLLYLYAYRYEDLDKISGYSALSDMPTDERPHDDSFLSNVLKPAARYHQRRLARECADALKGVWLLEEDDEFGSLVPKTLEFRHTSENRIAVSPSISSDGEKIEEFAATRWIRSDFPTAIHTGTTVDINMFSDDEIGVLTREMDPFGLGAKYKRQK